MNNDFYCNKTGVWFPLFVGFSRKAKPFAPPASRSVPTWADLVCSEQTSLAGVEIEGFRPVHSSARQFALPVKCPGADA